MIGFLRSSLSFAWLELKAFRFYPLNGALQLIQSFVGVGVWFFVSLFLKDFAAPDLSEYGGDFVAYMVIGVLFFQNAGTILTLPLASLTTAFWDKRLEVYHSRRHGIWAFITGRFIWLFCYNGIVMAAVLAFGILVAGVNVRPDVALIPALSFYVLFVLASFGIGLIGASNFFFLEVKQGRDPVTWVVDVLARIFSGVYYPLTIIPASLRWIGWCLPHTYALRGIRLVMIAGADFSDGNVLRLFLALLGFCSAALMVGVGSLNRAIRQAEATNGIGIVG